MVDMIDCLLDNCYNYKFKFKLINLGCRNVSVFFFWFYYNKLLGYFFFIVSRILKVFFCRKVGFE